MSALFSPLSIGKLQLPNRIVIAPMCQYSAEEGCARHWHLIHLGQLAASGAGLLIIEATAVAPEGRITPFDLGLYSDTAEEALGKVIGAARAVSDIRLGLQLAHAGRKASTASHARARKASLVSRGWRTKGSPKLTVQIIGTGIHSPLGITRRMLSIQTGTSSASGYC